MKVECENLSEREATPELIRELIRDDVRRGEFMILMQDADEEAFLSELRGDRSWRTKVLVVVSVAAEIV